MLLKTLAIAQMKGSFYGYLFALLLSGPLVFAEVSTTGDVQPADPTTWTTGTTACISQTTDGTLSVTNGSSIIDNTGFVGYASDATGTVTVDGTDSTWTNISELHIGEEDGNGTLNIANGGSVNAETAYIGLYFGSGVVNVNGVGSILTIGNSGTGALNGYLYISGKNPYEPGGNGTLHITNGGMVNSKAGLINYNLSDFESIGKVIVDGTGSIWNTDYFLLCGYSYTRTGMLSIANDGSVNVDGNASIFGINNCALLSIEISNNDMFTVSGNFTNNGLVRLSAEAGLSAGEYTPISVTGSWLGSGSYEVFGGVWDSTAHTFTVAAAQQTQAGQQTTINLQTTQRIEVGNTLEVNFAATQSSNPLNFTASVTGDAVLDALAALLSEGESVQGSWDFSISGLPVQSNVLLSFAVTGFDSADDLNVWYYDSVIGWVKSNANDLVLSDGWASFTVSRFSSYAITSVPEPATLSLLLISSIALLRRSSIQFTI